MSVFLFLLIPVVIVLVASLAVYLAGRDRTSVTSGVDGFQREMHALSPDGGPRKPRRFTADGPSTTQPPPRRPQGGG